MCVLSNLMSSILYKKKANAAQSKTASNSLKIKSIGVEPGEVYKNKIKIIEVGIKNMIQV